MAQVKRKGKVVRGRDPTGKDAPTKKRIKDQDPKGFKGKIGEQTFTSKKEFETAKGLIGFKGGGGEVTPQVQQAVQGRLGQVGEAQLAAAQPSEALIAQQQAQQIPQEVEGGVIETTREEPTALQQGAFKVLGALDPVRTAEEIQSLNNAEVIGESVRNTLMSGAVVGSGIALGAQALGAFVPSTISISPAIYKNAATKFVTGTATKASVNTKTAALTGSWLSKLTLGQKLGFGTAVVGGLMTAIGSYPFAGFIKEEALQSVGFASTNALNEKNLEGAEKAILLQEQILDPNLWNSILQKIPFTNILNSLEGFYKAAKIKLEVDKKRFNKMKGGL